MAETMIHVEVVYATVDCQMLIAVALREGSTVSDAVAASGIGVHFPELNLAESLLGIFGRVVSEPQSRLLEEGDRVEIYRALLADPKEARRLRAEKAALVKKQLKPI